MSTPLRKVIGLGVVAVPFGFLIGWMTHQEGELRNQEALRREEAIAARVRAELAKQHDGDAATATGGAAPAVPPRGGDS